MRFLLVSILLLYLIVVDIGLHAAEDYAAESATLPMIAWTLILADGSLGVGALAQVEGL